MSFTTCLPPITVGHRAASAVAVDLHGAVTALDWLPLLPLLLLLLAYTIRYRRFATGSTVVRCKIDIEFFGLAVPPDYRSSCTAIGIKRAPPVANRALSSTSSFVHLLHLYR